VLALRRPSKPRCIIIVEVLGYGGSNNDTPQLQQNDDKRPARGDQRSYNTNSRLQVIGLGALTDDQKQQLTGTEQRKLVGQRRGAGRLPAIAPGRAPRVLQPPCAVGLVDLGRSTNSSPMVAQRPGGSHAAGAQYRASRWPSAISLVDIFEATASRNLA
jgi:hypothetical protein